MAIRLLAFLAVFSCSFFVFSVEIAFIDIPESKINCQACKYRNGSLEQKIVPAFSISKFPISKALFDAVVKKENSSANTDERALINIQLAFDFVTEINELVLFHPQELAKLGLSNQYWYSLVSGEEIHRVLETSGLQKAVFNGYPFFGITGPKNRSDILRSKTLLSEQTLVGELLKYPELIDVVQDNDDFMNEYVGILPSQAEFETVLKERGELLKVLNLTFKPSPATDGCAFRITRRPLPR